jgi:hypothetical protein
MKCNKCKSSNVQKFQVIHEQGTSNINLNSNTVGGGVGFGGGLRGGLGLGRTGTSGTSQTLLAKKTEPPTDLRIIISAIIITILLFFYFYVGKILFVVSCILFGLIWLYFFITFGEQHNKNMSDWSKSWYCNKCGNSYVGK